MGNYELNRLNNNEFEHLVQSLSCKIFNYKNIIFGSGPDGAREATFEGNCTINNTISNGYHVIQAKFKECSAQKDSMDWEWAKKEFEKEMNKFEDKKRDLKTPDVYLFFTNIKFTSVHKTGGRDKIEEFKKKYTKLIPNIHIYGYDEICRFLDNNRDIATAYSSFILSGDILEELYSFVKINDKKDKNILFRFLNKEFDEDLYSKLEQANELTDKKINLEKVFVDLNITNDEWYEEGEQKFVNYCLEIGNRIWKDEQYKMVFIGGPGQGKSTVTQFLTQLYRVNFIKTFGNNISTEIQNFMNENVEFNLLTKCYRFPIRIILSDYSEWLNNRNKEGLSYTVLSYIQYKIESRADEKFSDFTNFRTFLEKLSFLFIFDGLDEVPSTSNRTGVILEIDNFINYELKTVRCDAIIIATTRPQGYSNEFDQTKFKHFRLDDMDNETCLNYLKKLIKNTISSEDDRKHQLKILKEALETELTSNIMRTPLQATIMAILVKSGGKPSKDKFSLFNDYYNTMVKREKQKNVLSIISEHEDYINSIHYLLGNKLQLLSQNEENSSSYINLENFKKLVQDYFVEQELDTLTNKKYTDQIMEAITDRLVFITENQEKKIGFAIRSTQEYFSAMYNVHNKRDEDVNNNIRIISKSIYWRNVFIFMLGYIAKNKGYLLDSLDSYIGELNGSDVDFEIETISKTSRYGTLLSLDILSESILSSWPKQENKFIKHLQEITNVNSSNDIEHILLTLKPKIVENLTNILLKSLSSNELYIRINCWKIISILSKNDLSYYEKFLPYWPTETNEELYCLEYFAEFNISTEYIFNKYSKYLKWSFAKNLFKYNLDFEFIEKLAHSESLNKNLEAKYFLIEYLFLNRIYPISYEENINKILFSLLNINKNSDFINLTSESNEVGNLGHIRASIKNIKDFNNNELLLELYSKTSNDNKLLLLSNFYKYLLEPSYTTLCEFIHTIEEKEKNGLFFNNANNIFEFNWQINYIMKKLNIGSSYNEIMTTINDWGHSLIEIKEFENKLNNKELIVDNIAYLDISYLHNDDNNKQIIIDFFIKYNIKNNPDLFYVFSILILLTSRNSQIDYIKDNENYHIILDTISDIINKEKSINNNIKIYLTIILLSIAENNYISNMMIDNSIFCKRFSPEIIGTGYFSNSIRNILDVITFNKKETLLIETLFKILTYSSYMPRKNLQNYDYSILLDLKYSNSKLKIYGYILSIISTKVNLNSEKMEKITSFLNSESKKDFMIIKYLNKIIEDFTIRGEFVETLLLKIYKNLNKNNLEHCIIASDLENNFRRIFENSYVNFEK